MFIGLQKDFRHVFGIGVHGAGEEGGAGTETNFGGEKGVVDGTHRGGFGDGSDFGSGRVLPFGQAVDFIVEENDIDIDIAADGVDEMVASDGKSVAVSGDDPYGEVGVMALEAGGEGRGAAMNGMETVGVHVVGETGGASNSGDKDDLFLGFANFGHGHLHGIEDGIVSTARTPADFLIRGKIFFRVLWHFSHNIFL